MDYTNIIGAVAAVVMAGLCAMQSATHYTTPGKTRGATYMVAALMLSAAAGYLVRG